jgi:hypothetical protein
MPIMTTVEVASLRWTRLATVEELHANEETAHFAVEEAQPRLETDLATPCPQENPVQVMYPWSTPTQIMQIT